MTGFNWNGPGDEISGEVIAVDGNAITIRTDDGVEVKLEAGGKNMDPNQTLREVRNAIGDFRNAVTMEDAERAATRLADSFEALDESLIKGGVLPADWLPAKYRNTTFAREFFAEEKMSEEVDAVAEKGAAAFLRKLHEEYPWTAFVPDEEWLAKIEEAMTHPVSTLPRPRAED